MPAAAEDKSATKLAAEDAVDDVPVIDMDTFNQLQEMDDDEDEREFSRGIVWTYFDQVPEKLEVIRTNLKDPENFLEVSQVAHFLKGSSAALGVARVTALFEKIQVTANDIYKAEKSARIAAAKAFDPPFDAEGSSLSDAQKAVLVKAKRATLDEDEVANVKRVQAWFERVEKEYKEAEEWLREEYGDDGEDAEGSEE